MTSDRQRDANRENARASTGPRTPEGKAAVRLVCDAMLSELRSTDRDPVPMHSLTVREAFRRVGADEWDAVSDRFAVAKPPPAAGRGVAAMAAPATLDKIWSSHAILVRLDGATLLHIDRHRHLVHDGSGNAFGMLKEISARSGRHLSFVVSSTVSAARTGFIEPVVNGHLFEPRGGRSAGQRADARPWRSAGTPGRRRCRPPRSTPCRRPPGRPRPRAAMVGALVPAHAVRFRMLLTCCADHSAPPRAVGTRIEANSAAIARLMRPRQP
jgi:hypothetical protein